LSREKFKAMPRRDKEFLGDQVGSWNFELTRNFGLAEAARRRRILQSIF
jgi:hypothetical protein